MIGRTFTSSQRFGRSEDGNVLTPALSSVVCVSNPDAKKRLCLNECIVGRVFRIFCNSQGEVWCDVRPFARPNYFPPNVDTGNYILDEDREVVVDCRGNEASFSVDEIFSECEIIEGDPGTSVESILRRNSLSGSSQKGGLPVFVLRFRLLEKESSGYFLQPLIPLPKEEMSPAKPDVLSEIGVNVKEKGHKESHEDIIKSALVVLEDCCNIAHQAKENVEEFENRKLLSRSHQSSEKSFRSPSKPLESPTRRCSVRRSIEFSSPPCKRIRSEYGDHGLKVKLECSSTAESETSEDIAEDTETAWVSKLLDVNEPVTQSGGQTPIRLSLIRVRQNATPSKQSDSGQVGEDEVQADRDLRSARKSTSVNVADDLKSRGTPQKNAEAGNLETLCRPSRRSSRVLSDETKPENRSMTSRPKRSCTEVKPYYGMSDESDFCSPEESKRPVLNRTSRKESRTAHNETKPKIQSVTARPRRSCTKKARLSYNGTSGDSDCCSSEESKGSLANRSHGGTRKSLRSQKKPISSPTQDPEELTCPSKFTTPSKTTKSSNQNPRNSSKTPLKTPAKSPKTSKAKTPLRTPSKRCLTPSMPTRVSAPLTPLSSLEQIRKNLHVSAIPMSLPCRETEYRSIYNFLENKIIDAAGGCMYISGVPGTGKTATVHAVIRSLKEQVEEKQINDFQYIEVNGLRMTEPRQVFVQVLKGLTGQKCTPQQAQDILSQKFCSGSSKNKTVVLLVDEVDMLRNRRQDVIYNLFDWPSKPNSRLIVLTIANTMDLPERLLKGRVTSRLGLTRLTFQPYSYKQLQAIVMSRLQGSTCFNDEAVELVARKVAACSGDVRRALDICRRASELVVEGSPVTMPIINKVLSQMMNSANVCSIKACSKLEKLFLQAVVAENERTGVEEATFFAVYRQFQSLCALASTALINISEAMAVLNRLGASGLLLTEHARADINQSIFLNVNTDDVHYALNQTSST